MRFVETKTPEQQSCLMLHRTRHLFIRQQTSVINAIRAHLAEFGIVAPVGRNGVPKQNSSGGKQKLGSISKQGDRYLRSLFTAGALAVIRYARIHGGKHRPWLTALLARRPTKVAAIALANKIARMAWAMMARGERYREPVALAA
jgi:transposase